MTPRKETWVQTHCQMLTLFSIYSLEAQTVKNLPAMREMWFEPWIGKSPWRRRVWQPTPVFLPGESPWTEDPGGL